MLSASKRIQASVRWLTGDLRDVLDETDDRVHRLVHELVEAAIDPHRLGGAHRADGGPAPIVARHGFRQHGRGRTVGRAHGRDSCARVLDTRVCLAGPAEKNGHEGNQG
jgi:hypothetical protein